MTIPDLLSLVPASSSGLFSSRQPKRAGKDRRQAVSLSPQSEALLWLISKKESPHPSFDPQGPLKPAAPPTPLTLPPASPCPSGTAQPASLCAMNIPRRAGALGHVHLLTLLSPHDSDSPMAPTSFPSGLTQTPQGHGLASLSPSKFPMPLSAFCFPSGSRLPHSKRFISPFPSPAPSH